MESFHHPTSKLLAVGVDVQTCKLIVLDQRIQSMSQFKQIIGRGTRINEDFDKYFFTIMDFKKATELFADPDFDGPPIETYEPEATRPTVQHDKHPDPGITYVVGDVDVWVVAERVQYYGKDGKLITESLKDYTRKTVLKDFTSLDSFLNYWGVAEQKLAVIRELEEHGVMFEELEKHVGKDYDPFDLICHVAFDQPSLSR
ncbi:MAG: hypothetical protein C5S48_00450 [Candidatus Methanogaster sp.]|nr:MAG: hypothetical protein C5S48_00450 [ANME-2 cluster archaeon]